MQTTFLPDTRVPGARRRIDPDTLMAMVDKRGRPLWDMPPPVGYAEHTKWRKHKHTGKRIGEPIQVPIYRGTSASYARWVKSQIRRSRRKAAEAQALVNALNEAEKNRLQEIDNA